MVGLTEAGRRWQVASLTRPASEDLYLVSECETTRMLDVGILGLDTSHANAFAPIIDDRDDMRLHGIWDNRQVRDSAYVESFCEDHGATEYDDVEDMVGEVDAAMVLTVNWDTHRALAAQFLDAEIPTLIDKPIAGSYDDLLAIERAAADTPLFGGSAVPYADEFAALPRGTTDDDRNRTIFAVGYNDYFYYRVHIVDVVRTLADAAWTEITPASAPGTSVDVRFENGVYATIRFDGDPSEGAFCVLDVGETTDAIKVESGEEALVEMYRTYLDAFAATARGERDDTDRVIDAGRLLLGVEAAIADGHTVTPGSAAVQDVHASGADFLADYQPYY